LTLEKNNLYLIQANLIIYQKAVYYSGIKFFNILPFENKIVTVKQKSLKCFETE